MAQSRSSARIVFEFGFLLILGLLFTLIPARAAWGPWENHGPQGGTVRDVRVLGPHTVVAATNGGIHRSTDGGDHWYLTDAVGSFDSFATSPADSDVVYALGSVLVKSTDAGASWTTKTIPTNYTQVRDFALSRSSAAVVYMAAGQRFYKSTDSGGAWTYSTAGLPSESVKVVAVDPNSSTLYLGTSESGVYKSTNGGDNWQPASTGVPAGGLNDITVSPLNSDIVFAAGDFGLYKTTDRGVSWQPAGTGIPPATEVETVSITQAGSPLYVTCYEGVYWSTDQGGSWAPRDGGISDRSLTTSPVAIDGSDASVLYVGHLFDGVYRSTNTGAAWSLKSSGLNARDIAGVFVDRSNFGHVYAATFGGLYRSTDGGLSWGTPVSFYLLDEFVVDPLHPEVLYAGGNHVHKSTDRGLTWQLITNLANLGAASVSAMAIDPQTPTRLYVGTNGFYRSTNSGGIWTKTWPASGTRTVRKILVDSANPQTLYLAAAGSPTFYKSTDSGLTWAPRITGLPDDSIDDADIDPLSANRLLAAIDGSGIYRSTDGGASWHVVDSSAEVRDSRRVAYDPDAPDTAYVMTGHGLVFKTTNGGSFWTPVTPVMAHTVGSAPRMAVSPFVQGRVFIGTAGGLWQQTFGEESVFYFPQVANGTISPLAIKTSLMFANPGSPSTVRVEFFSSNGQPMPLAFGGSDASSQLFFRLKQGAAFSGGTSGAGPLQVGYAKVHAPVGVGGTAVFSYAENGVTSYETGVPATIAQTDFTIFVDATSGHDTGFALVNAGDGPASVTVRLYDAQAHLQATRNLNVFLGSDIPPGRHMAIYASQLFTQTASLPGGAGVMTFESDQPLAAITLREEDNRTVPFPTDITKMCTLPVVPGRADKDNLTGGLTTYYFPQVANGQLGDVQIRTAFVFVNTGGLAPLKVEFFDAEGAPLSFPFVAGGSASTIQLNVARGFAVFNSTTGTGPLRVGYAKVTTTGRVGGAAVFTYLEDEKAMYTAGVPASDPRIAFTLFMDASGNKHNTGLALSGCEIGDANITFRLYDKDSNLLATRTAAEVLGHAFTGGAHIALFANEIFPIITADDIEEGVITVRSNKLLAPVTLRECDDPTLGFPADLKLMTTFPVVPGAP